MLASLALLPLLAVSASASSALAPRMTSLFSRQISESSIPAACPSTCTTTINIYNACLSNDLTTCLTVCQQDTFNSFIGCFDCIVDNTPGVTLSEWTQLQSAVDQLKAECSRAGQTVTGGLDTLNTALASASGTATGATAGVASSASGVIASISSAAVSFSSAAASGVTVAASGQSSISSIASAAVASASSSVASASVNAATTSASAGTASATAAAEPSPNVSTSSAVPSSSVSMSSASPLMDSATGVLVVTIMAVGLGAWIL